MEIPFKINSQIPTHDINSKNPKKILWVVKNASQDEIKQKFKLLKNFYNNANKERSSIKDKYSPIDLVLIFITLHEVLWKLKIT